ncbi:MAG: mechanosensitive ion channel family protein [Bacteriovoracia bacterium]
MRVRSGQPLIPLEKIEAFLQVEPTFVILGMALASFLIYKFFLRNVTAQRHENLKSLFKNLAVNGLAWGVCFAAYIGLERVELFSPDTHLRIVSYVGFLTLVTGSVVFVKTSRLLVMEYLFFGHMKEGVPILLVNLFTLLVSIVLAGWYVTDIFGVQLTPFLATSAILSLVLGLALQDTLGNLFAGIALQLDKPFEIGDWLEIQFGVLKWTGQIYEITWRAVHLTGLDEERLTIPNRVVAQGGVTNLSATGEPIVQTLALKLPHDCDLPRARAALAEAAGAITRVVKRPLPYAQLSEATDAGITCKLVYFIQDYGRHSEIADEVMMAALHGLRREGIALATPRLHVDYPGSPKANGEASIS